MGDLPSESVGRSNGGCAAVGKRSGNGACAGLFGKKRCQSGYGGNPGVKNCEPGNIKNGLGREAIVGICGTLDPKNDGFECVAVVGGDDNELECVCWAVADCVPEVVSQNRLCFDSDVTVEKL